MEDKPIRLIRACTEDTEILTSLLRWLNAERASALNKLGDEKDEAEIHRLQGKAAGFRHLHELIAGWSRPKITPAPRERFKEIG